MDINTLTMPVELIVIPFVEGTMPSRDAIRERICKWGSPELEMVVQPRYSTMADVKQENWRITQNLVILSTTSYRNHHHISEGRLHPSSTLDRFISIYPCSIDSREKVSK
jgi:hypothetical protein